MHMHDQTGILGVCQMHAVAQIDYCVVEDNLANLILRDYSAAITL